MKKKEVAKAKKNNTKKLKINNIKNKGKHKKKVLRVLVYTVLIVFVLSLLFLITYGIYFLRTSSRYNIKNITFKGNVSYSTEMLLKVADIPIGENLYKISKNTIEKNLKELPYINTVKINRNLPETLVISVTENKSKYLAYNKENDKYIRLTNEGIMLEEIKGEEKKEQELLVFGINFDDKIQFKNPISELEKKKLTLYNTVNEKYKKSGIDKKITSIEFKENNVILTLNYDMNVIFNEDNLDYNMTFLKSILEKIEGKAGVVDMTKTNPVFTESIK